MKRFSLFVIALLFVTVFSGFAFAQGSPGTSRFPANLDTSDTLFQVANGVRSNLNGSISGGDVNLSLVNASLFPSSGAVSIDGEILYYTGKSGNQLTGLIRAQDGTSAQSHNTNASVRASAIAAHHRVQSNAIIATQNKIGTGGGAPQASQVLFGTSAGVSVWSGTPNLTRLDVMPDIFNVPSPSAQQFSRILIYNANINGEYMAIGVEPNAQWFNNISNGSYKFYFGANPNSVYVMSPTNLKATGTIQLTSANRPPCNAANRFTFFAFGSGSGTKDAVEVCVKTAADNYVWTVIY